MRHRRRTKIVATLGPATDVPGVIDAMLVEGVDCLRLNCSHGDEAQFRERAAAARAAVHAHGRPIGLMLDLQGPKLRLGDVPDRGLTVGEHVRLTAHPDGDKDVIPVAFEHFGELVSADSEIVIGDGTPRLVVRSLEGEHVLAEVEVAGRIGPRKGIAVAHAATDLPALTEKDERDLAVGVDLDAEFVALSFVRTADDVRDLRGRLEAAGSTARVIAKIEKAEAYERIDEIIAAADGVMVARGDYGVEVGVAHVPRMQKDVIGRATQAGKLVITATQMLESMIESAEPTRAEAADVANAVIDGTSAVMLSAETSIGAHPVAAIRHMAMIARVAEQANDIYCATHHKVAEHPDRAVMHAAVALGRDTDADALVIPTTTGGAARACSKYRPRRPIIALTHDEQVADQLALEWGVYPGVHDWVRTVDDLIAHAIDAARDIGKLEPGARVVITAGPAAGHPGATNMILLREIGATI